MHKSVKAIIFDVGGVLVRTEDPTRRRQLAADLDVSLDALHGIVFGSDSWNLARTGRITTDDHWRAVGRRLGLAWPDKVNAFRKAFFAGDRLDRDMIALIRRLRAWYKIALLSNAPGNLRRWIAKEWEIPDDTFDEIVVSAEEGIMKPDPEIYRLTLARLNVAPHEAIFVDDLLKNVEAARALGIEAIHFTSPEALMTQLNAWVNVDVRLEDGESKPSRTPI